jgi:integrase
MTMGKDDAKINEPTRRRRAGKEALHVNAFPDKYGKMRRYFRVAGRNVAIPGEPGSLEYTKAWLAEMEKLPVHEIGKAKRSKPGSVSDAIASYFQSNQYFLEQLSEGTRRSRTGILNRFREYDGDLPIASLRRSDIIDRLDKLLPSTRRNWLVALRGLMEYAVAKQWLKEDPTIGIKGYKPPAKADDDDEEEGWQTWPEEWIEQYEGYHPIGSTARLTEALALIGGQRRSDVIRMGPGMVEGGMIILRQKKTRRHKGIAQIEITPELAEIIAASVIGIKTYLVMPNGRPFTVSYIGAMFRQWCDEAGLPPEASMHGLRKAWCRRAAAGAATEDQMMAVTGHRTSKQLREYLAKVNRGLLARQGMAAAERGAEAERQQNAKRRQTYKPAAVNLQTTR